MSLGPRSKLFALHMASTLGLLLVFALGMDSTLRGWMEERERAELQSHARAAEALLHVTPRATHAKTLEDLSRKTGVSITTRDATTPRADSHVYTHTITHTDGALTIALRHTGTGHEDALRRARVVLFVTALLGMLASLLLGALAAQFFTRTLGSLTDYARTLAGANSRVEGAPSWRELSRVAMPTTQLAEELEAAVKSLARERDRVETVLETMHEAVIALDERHRITLINRAARDFLEPQLHAIGKEPVGERLTDLLRLPPLLDLLEAGAEGDNEVTEFTLPGPPQRTVAAHLSARGSAEGARLGYVLVMHDVTELRKLEVMRRDFITNISHELRTPVSVIMSTSETLLDGAIDDPRHARGFVDAVHRNAERLSRLINDLLDISRLESGRVDLHPEAVSLFGVALHVIDTLEQRARERNQEIDLDVDMDTLVLADPKALDQIVFNLIDNAIKYTPPGGAITIKATHVEKSRDMTRDEVRLEVSDEGPGLDPEHRNRVFERFYRVDKGRSRDQGGTGLGLSIVKHLVQAMGGRVGVRANAPKGATFWVRLPDASDTIPLDA